MRAWWLRPDEVRLFLSRSLFLMILFVACISLYVNLTGCLSLEFGWIQLLVMDQWLSSERISLSRRMTGGSQSQWKWAFTGLRLCCWHSDASLLDIARGAGNGFIWSNRLIWSAQTAAPVTQEQTIPLLLNKSKSGLAMRLIRELCTPREAMNSLLKKCIRNRSHQSQPRHKVGLACRHIWDEGDHLFKIEKQLSNQPIDQVLVCIPLIR